MTLRKFFTRGGLLLALLVLLAGNLLAQGGAARVRFVHVVPGAAALDIYINGALALKGVDYGARTTYLSVPSGAHTVAVTPSGIKTILAEQSITLDADSITTFIASDPANLQFMPFEESLADPTLGKGRLQIVNAVAGLPTIDVQVAEDVEVGAATVPAGSTVVSATYDDTINLVTFDLEAKTYPFQIAANDSVILSDLDVPVTSGTAEFLVIYGSADAPQALLLTASASVPSGTGFVRFIHGIVGAPAVDVFVNDTLIAPALSTERPTEHMGLPSGEHALELRVAGSDDILFEGDIEVTAGAIQTVVILQGDTEIELQPLDDTIGGITAGSAGVTVINTIPGTDNIAVNIGGETAGDNVTFGQGSETASLTPVYAPLSMNITRGDISGTIDLPAHTFYGGVYYTLIALDGGSFSGPRLLIIPTAVAQGLASAPGAGTETIASNAVPPTQIAAAPTTVAETAETQAPDAATPAPQLPTSTLAPLPTQDPTIRGRVILDPGANLQLREYPNADARSLGLAPSGTEFIVNGREGAPVALTAEGEPPPEATDFVDPVTLLDPLDLKADLIAGDTWINVTYNTPDGGSIIAWVNAQYVDVRNARGEKVRLADLPTVGQNVPGESRSTSVTSPTGTEDVRTAIVQGLDADTNLNIRRTPETAGEVLGRAANGDTLEFVGLNEAEDWAYVSYRPEEGGVISGWVSVEFLRYQVNGQDVELEALVYDVVSDDLRGTIGSGAETVALPTVETLRNTYVAEVRLDPGSNLQLRRDPNVDAESLSLIPSGTQVLATGRTDAADWLFVEFEGEEGWINTRYVVVRYNGNVIAIEKVPVLLNGTTATITPTVEGGAPAVVPTTDPNVTPTETPIPVEPTAVPTTAA